MKTLLRVALLSFLPLGSAHAQSQRFDATAKVTCSLPSPVARHEKTTYDNRELVALVLGTTPAEVKTLKLGLVWNTDNFLNVVSCTGTQLASLTTEDRIATDDVEEGDGEVKF